MVKRAQTRMVVILAVAFAAGFLALGYRLVDLQVFRHEKLTAQAVSRTINERLLEPRRGDIMDIKGDALARTEYRKLVWADPSFIEDWHQILARTIAPYLKADADEIEKKLRLKTKRRDDGTIRNIEYVVLADKVPVEDWQKLQAVLKELENELRKTNPPPSKDALAKLKSAISARDQQIRVYPHARLASHVVGFAGSEERALADLELSDAKTPAVQQIVGRDGLELVFDEKLAGAHGWRVTEYGKYGNRYKKTVELVSQRKSDVPARDGLNVFVTIDSYIQDIVEQALADAMEKHKPISISGIVVRPATGEILSLACLPDYDPNFPNSSSLDARRNRVISDIAEPGSTFKIVVTAGALNEHVVSLTDRFDCEEGSFYYGGRLLRDHHSYRNLSVEEIITKSSNIGAAKIGIQLGDKRLYDYIRVFGFGSRTGIPLLGEVPGIVHPVSSWRKVSLAQIPMGHGIAVTRLQMVMAMAAIANKGQLMRPMLIDRLEDPDHNVVAKYTSQKVGQIVSEKTAREMVQALKTVVGPEGTAPDAALENYTVAGKTGTAQKVENGGYSDDKYLASFIGFFPADNPEVCIGVTLDEPRNRKYGHFGGAVAGPVFKQIAESVAKYLSIPSNPPATNNLRVATATTHPSALKMTPARER